MLFPVAGSVFLSLRSLCSSQQEITRNLFFTISLFDFKLHENLIQSRILEPVQSTPAHLHFRSARLHDLSALEKKTAMRHHHLTALGLLWTLPKRGVEICARRVVGGGKYHSLLHFTLRTYAYILKGSCCDSLPSHPASSPCTADKLSSWRTLAVSAGGKVNCFPFFSASA